jgi:hypothetical protein
MEFPKRIFGVDTAKAYEEVMREERPKKRRKKVSREDREGFIYVPSIDLYFAKERSLLGKNWNETHFELDKQGMKMPSIYEFKEFLRYLLENPNEEYTRIFNDITEVKSPWRAEWLDAKFDEKKIYFNHGIVNGKLIAGNSETLDRETLMKDKLPGIGLEYWLKNSTKQGWPKKNCDEGSLWYWYPRDGAVAGFGADEDSTYLICSRNPANSYGPLGVRAVRRFESRSDDAKNGGKR